jgi:hypothetical protein
MLHCGTCRGKTDGHITAPLSCIFKVTILLRMHIENAPPSAAMLRCNVQWRENFSSREGKVRSKLRHPENLPGFWAQHPGPDPQQAMEPIDERRGAQAA